MRAFVFLVIFSLLTSLAMAFTSSPEAFIPASGYSDSAFYENFTVFGECISGLAWGSSFASGIGLTDVIFAPLLPMAGQTVPTVPSGEGEVVCYPNPFNPAQNQSITISYKYSTDTEVKLMIFDISGQLIQTIRTTSADRASDGYSRVTWDGKTGFSEVADNGVYLTSIIADGRVIAKTKIMVVK